MTTYQDKINAPCNVCCHETINAMASLIFLAKHVRKENPSMATVMLDAAILRLENNIKRCRK